MRTVGVLRKTLTVVVSHGVNREQGLTIILLLFCAARGGGE